MDPVSIDVQLAPEFVDSRTDPLLAAPPTKTVDEDVGLTAIH